MSEIGFERTDSPSEDKLDGVETFQQLYEEITDCRRGIDQIRSGKSGAPDADEVWASYRELKGVLESLGIRFPTFNEDDYGRIWNREFLHSLFLQKLAVFARLGDLDSAREFVLSEEWESTFAEYAHGHPIDEPPKNQVEDYKMAIAAFLTGVTVVMRNMDQITYADPLEFVLAVEHGSLRGSPGLTVEQQSLLLGWTEHLRRLCP